MVGSWPAVIWAPVPSANFVGVPAEKTASAAQMSWHPDIDGWHREGGRTWVKSHVINKNSEFTNKLMDLSYQKLCLVTKRMTN